MTDSGPDVRQLFSALVRESGSARSAHVTMAPDEELLGENGCWSAAWAYAQEHDCTYVEGQVVLPPVEGSDRARVVRAHAWAEKDGAFGRQIVECTRGYEDGIRYRGIEVDSTPGGPIDTISAQWKGERASVIQALIAGGVSGLEILRMIASRS